MVDDICIQDTRHEYHQHIVLCVSGCMICLAATLVCCLDYSLFLTEPTPVIGRRRRAIELEHKRYRSLLLPVPDPEYVQSVTGYKVPQSVNSIGIIRKSLCTLESVSNYPSYSCIYIHNVRFSRTTRTAPRYPILRRWVSLSSSCSYSYHPPHFLMNFVLVRVSESAA
jgi:hypothetical protein